MFVASLFIFTTLVAAVPYQHGHVRQGPIPRPRDVSNGTACAAVSSTVASLTAASPSATPTIPAQLAYDCITSVPLNVSAATQLIDSLPAYIQWQTTLSYLKDPPAEYAEKIQPAVDVYGTLQQIRDNVTSGAFENEYQFGFALYRLFQSTHDGHLVYVPDVVSSIFTWGRPVALVSVSADGQAIPEIYVYSDVLAASFGNATFSPAAVTSINGEDAVDYLLDWSENGSLQDRDALWNNVFYELAQVSLGSSGSGTGTFSGSGRGRYVYAGPTTTLGFANGSTTTYENFARVFVDFAGVQSGSDLHLKYFTYGPEALETDSDPPKLSNVTATVTATTTGTSAPTSTAASTTTSAASTPSPGYPPPIVRQPNNLNGGYYIDQEGYSDIAVLSVASFVGLDSAEQSFQDTNVQFIKQAKADGKTKLIIDVSANGGGTILQGYDLFKILFPSILPYGGNRWRDHESINLIGEQFSLTSGQYPRVYDSGNDTLDEINYDIESSNFNYRTDDDVNYQPFPSWPAKYGPTTFNGDQFSPIVRWNLSDVLTPYNSGGIFIHGYGIPNVFDTSPFAPEDMIILYDGYCASTCTIFSELMRQQGGVKTIFVGGRPNKNITQAVGGVKGVNDFPITYIKQLVDLTYTYADNATRASYSSTALNTYNTVPIERGATGVSNNVNFRDGLRQGDPSGVPLQFRYETADCRIFYTPAMTVDVTALWKTVADTAFNGQSACVAGNLTAPATRRSEKRHFASLPHVQRRDSAAEMEALMNSLDVHTDLEKARLNGDGIMYP
ncbi:MAG: hypothetical protein Q9227_000328 [Pyrenula ochraceoflavens]